MVQQSRISNTFVERRKWDSDTFAGVKIYPFLINDTSHQNHALQFVLQIFTHFKPFPQKTICACCSSWSFLTLPSPFKKNSDDFSSSCHSYKHTKLYLSFLYIHYVMQNINDLQSFCLFWSCWILLWVKIINWDKKEKMVYLNLMCGTLQFFFSPVRKLFQWS